MGGVGTYAYLNARLRGRLGKLMSAGQYDQLLAATDLNSVYDVLGQTEYGEIVRETGATQELRRMESAFVEHLVSSHREVAAHCKGSVRGFILELMRKYEVENLKVALRAWNAGEDGEFIYREPIVHRVPVDSILQSGTIEEIIVLLEGTPYTKPLAQAREQYKKKDSLFYLEIALDKELYEATWRAIAQLDTSDRRIASKLIGIETDILNINWILRFKRYHNLGLAEITSLMLPKGFHVTESLVREAYPGRDQASLISALLTGVYGTSLQAIRTGEETQALHLLEELLREVYVQHVKSALGGYPFTIGVAIAYLRLKQMEVSNIITILNAKALKVPPDETQRYLVRL